MAPISSFYNCMQLEITLKNRKFRRKFYLIFIILLIMATNNQDVIELLRKIIAKKGKGPGATAWLDGPYQEIEI